MTEREALKLALEALTHYVQAGLATLKTIDALKAIKETLAQPEQELLAWKNAALRVGEDLSSIGPNGYYNMTAQQWLDWAMAQQPRGNNSLAQPEQERCEYCKRGLKTMCLCGMKAQPEQEPVAWRVSPRYEDLDGYFDFTDSKDTAETLQQRGWEITPVYTTPPQRKPLTVDEVWQNDELMALNAQLVCGMDLLMEVVRAIEAAHGIKGDT